MRVSLSTSALSFLIRPPQNVSHEDKRMAANGLRRNNLRSIQDVSRGNVNTFLSLKQFFNLKIFLNTEKETSANSII